MKTTPIFLFSILLLGACGGPAARAKRPGAKAQAAAAVQAEPKTYTYRIAATYPHSTGAYTQGLQYVDGTMWEGTGQHGESVVRKTDLATGKTEVMARLPRSEFGEGITLLGGKLYQLTWQSNTAHVYSLENGKLQKIRDFRYPGEGWGLTTDGEKLYMSDGTATIHTVDPATFRREKRVTVTYKGAPVEYLNELDRQQNMGQRLHHRPDRRHRPRDGRRRGRRRPRGAAARNGNDRDDRRAERHRL